MAASRASRPRLDSYDIDNIIIPHNYAANTRLEILHYKEIITPKWRVLDVPAEAVPGNNGILKRTDSEKTNPDRESDEEDISDQRLLERHHRCEQLERGKFRVQNATGTRRHHTSQSSTSLNHNSESLDEAMTLNQEGTADTEVVSSMDQSLTVEMAPECIEDNGSAVENVQTMPPIIKRRPTLQSEDTNETVRPFTPRAFPLSEENYVKMLLAMPENHPLKGSCEEEEAAAGEAKDEPAESEQSEQPEQPR